MMQLTRGDACLSDLALDAWSSGELDPRASGNAAAHVARCGRCHERHRAMEAVRADFYAAAPSFSSFQSPNLWAKPAPRKLVPGGALATLLAAAAAVLLMLSHLAPETRQKGGPSLGYFVKRGQRIFPGERASALHPGDLIRFTYSSQQPRYLALFSRDAQGTTIYFPSGEQATRVQSEVDAGLDFSVELDEVLGDEQVLALFCEESFELTPLLSALRETGRLPVPSGCQQLSLTLHKVATP